LSRPDAVRLHEIIRRLAGSGTTIVLVSHFLREVLDLAREVTILRDGRVVRTGHAADETEQSLLSAMLGRSLGAAFPAKRPAGGEAPVVLSVAGLSAAGVNNVSLEVRAGEIVGLAGLVGAGRTELARAVQGASPIAAGTVSVAGGRELASGPPGAPGRLRRQGSIRRALAAGLAMIPESRQEQGLFPGRSVTENVSLASLGQFSRLGFVRGRDERGAVGRMLGKVDVRAPSQAAPVSTLSGGNQQKVLFARMLLCGPRVLVADEPTRGVDVGAKRAIYDLLTSLAADGLGVLLISSDMEEILGLAHRVLVMRRGKITAELSGGDLTEAAILGAAFDTAERGAS
jgi:ABC-type sugar transport system ATPase subunit